MNYAYMGVMVVLFATLTIIYLAMLYIKGANAASYLDYAVLYAINYYVFVPLRSAWRIEDDEVFWDVLFEGHTSTILNAILFCIVGYVLLMLSSYIANTSSIILGIIGLFLVLVSLFFSFNMWRDVTYIPLVTFSSGTLLDKMGILISFIGMITFLTLNDCSGKCSFFWTLFHILVYITICTPIFLSVISMIFKLFDSALKVDSDAYLLMFYAYLLIPPMTLPVINFALDVPKEILHIVSLLFSIPMTFTLIRMINTVVLRKKALNIKVTMSLLVLFYGTIFFQFFKSLEGPLFAEVPFSKLLKEEKLQESKSKSKATRERVITSKPTNNANKKYALYLKTIPEDAKVKITNLNLKYRYGMLLKPGVYDIEISKRNYQTIQQRVEIKDRNQHMNFYLF